MEALAGVYGVLGSLLGFATDVRQTKQKLFINSVGLSFLIRTVGNLLCPFASRKNWSLSGSPKQVIYNSIRALNTW